MNIDDLLHEMADNLALAKAGGDVKEIAAAQNALANELLLGDYIQKRFHDIWVRYEADRPYAVVTRALADLGLDHIAFETKEASELGEELYAQATDLQFKSEWIKYISQAKKTQSLKAHYADFIVFATKELESNWNSDFDDSITADDIAWMNKSSKLITK